MNEVGISYLLWAACFFGPFGLHRLYNGKVASGLLWMCTFGLLGIGQLMDLLLIPNMVEERNAEIRGKLGVSTQGVPLYNPTGAIAVSLPQPSRDRLTVRLLKAAAARGGKISVTQGVMATGASFTEVESVLTEMLKSGYVSIDNDPNTGIVIYEFLELSSN